MAYSVFDVLRYPNLAHVDPRVLPTILEDKKSSLVIRTKEIVSQVNEGTILQRNEQTGKMIPTKVVKSGYVSLWLVFGWDNDLRMECLNGQCEVTKLDTIVYLKVIYPGLSDYRIEYLMDLSSPIDKYIKTDVITSIVNEKATLNQNRVNSEHTTSIISYDEMVDQDGGSSVPQKIRNVLLPQNLIGGVIYDRKDGVRRIETLQNNGVNLSKPVVKYDGKVISEGLLRKISLL